MSRSPHRRDFLRKLGALGVVAAFPHPAIGRAGPGPNDKLNIGLIGTAGRARDNTAGVESENIVALCDIDDRLIGQAAARFPSAKTYDDFRKLMDAATSTPWSSARPTTPTRRPRPWPCG